MFKKIHILFIGATLVFGLLTPIASPVLAAPSCAVAGSVWLTF